MTYPSEPANSDPQFPPGYHTPPTPLPPDAGQQFYPPAPPPQRRGMSTGAIIGLVVGLVAVLCLGATVAAALITPPGDDKPDGKPAAGVGSPAPYDALPGQPAATTASAAPTSRPPTSAAPAGPKTSFGDGTWEVGATAGLIAPGKYRTTVPASSFNCYWERLKGTSGGFDDILANDNHEAGTQAIVTIAATDAAFKSRGCGTWQKA